MTSENPRTRRVAEQVQRLLAGLLQSEIKDPRLGMVTVSAVRVSPDLSHARVFITSLNTDDDIGASLDVLNRATGFLRKRIGQEMTTRTVPRLQFVYDESIEYGAHLSSLIEGAVSGNSSEEKD